MRASRRSLASRSCWRSSAVRFLGRRSIMMQGSLRCAGAVWRSERTVASCHPLAELPPQFTPNVHRHLASTALGAMARVVKAEREDSGTPILAARRQGARGSIVPIRRRETRAIVVSRAQLYDVFAVAIVAQSSSASGSARSNCPVTTSIGHAPASARLTSATCPRRRACSRFCWNSSSARD
jgi:hypothetical protein